MRVRFYAVGEATHVAAVQWDHFPLVLGWEDESLQLTDQPAEGVCRIEDGGGQLLFEQLDEGHPVFINGAPLATGPLSPGDQLSIDGHRYLVSYEQTGVAHESEARYRLAME